MHEVLLQEACIADALGMVGLRHTLLQGAFFLKSSEQLLQIVLSQETLWNAAGNEVVIDVKSREEDESAANGPQWAEGARSSLLGPFLRFLPRKLLHDSAGEQASR